MKAAVIFPSPSTWITPRTTGTQLTSENCQIILNRRIENVQRVIINTEGLYCGVDNGDDIRDEKITYLCTSKSKDSAIKELDITKYIVEKAKYQTLALKKMSDPNWKNELYVQNTTYWEHNTNIIYILNDAYYGITPVTRRVFNVIIGRALHDLAQTQQLYLAETDDYFSPVTDVTFAQTKDNDPRRAQFRIYYTPLGESVKLNVPKTNPQSEQFVIPYSQQQPIVDNLTHGREMQSIANRAGCETKEVVRTFPGIEHYRSPHDHWFYREKDKDGKPTSNVWRLTSATLSVVGYNNEKDVHVYRSHEVWSKNWSYRSPNVPINREFRSWNIPADTVQRNLLWQDYCLLTKKSVSLPDNALLSDWARRQLLYTLQNNVMPELCKDEMSALWFYTKDGDNRKGVALSCSSFGFGNSLVFSGKTKDNLSAGVQRVKSDDDDDNYQFCKDVYYCNEDGTLDKMYIQLAGEIASKYIIKDSTIPADFSNEYPEYSDKYNSLTQTRTMQNAIPDGEQVLFKRDMDFRVLKDPAEQLNFTYQLHLLTDDGSLVIGSAWAASNPLIMSVGDAGTKVKYWYLTSLLPAAAMTMTTVYGAEVLIADLKPLPVLVGTGTDKTIQFADVSGKSINGKPVVGLCVTTEDNKVLIAYNSAEGGVFNVAFTHSYADMHKAIVNHAK